MGLIDIKGLQKNGVLTDNAKALLEGVLFDSTRVNINVLSTKNSASTAINLAIQYKAKKDEKALNNVKLGEASGVWKIIQYIEEVTVANRLVIDSSISTSSGSIINYVNKICQEPFVEFFGDTYANKYSFMVRKCPYDEKGYTSLIEKTINEDTGLGFIRSNSVINESLSFDDNDIYSWYILRPKGHLVGAEEFSLSYLPALYFGEYVDVWGSRPLDVTTNYYPLLSKFGSTEAERAFDFEKSIFQELKFLIDCNSYLPFSRKGRITLEGDRRIKIGTAIYYEPTDEYYQVDDVSQSFLRDGTQNERTTTLVVSRGLKKEHFQDYFKVIHTNLDDKQTKQKRGDSYVFNREVVSNWKVDKDKFNFFMKRQQFK